MNIYRPQRLPPLPADMDEHRRKQIELLDAEMAKATENITVALDGVRARYGDMGPPKTDMRIMARRWYYSARIDSLVETSGSQAP